MSEQRREGLSRSALPDTGPEATFWSAYPAAHTPIPARDWLPKMLPLAAVQKCPPVTTASSMGWLLHPPESFAVTWSGDDLLWSPIDDDSATVVDWRPVGGDGPRSAQLKVALDGVPEERRAAAEEIGLTWMPLLDPSPMGDPREFQLISGIVATTASGWALLVRGVPNLPRATASFDVVEGVVETAWSGHMLPVMIRLREEGTVVRFSKRRPVAVLHPVAVASYTREATAVVDSGSGFGTWPEEVWQRYVAGRTERMGEPAAYRRAQAAHYREMPPVIDAHG